MEESGSVTERPASLVGFLEETALQMTALAAIAEQAIDARDYVASMEAVKIIGSISMVRSGMLLAYEKLEASTPESTHDDRVKFDASDDEATDHEPVSDLG